MSKAIYKIENKINHKVYIGQTLDPKRRFREHCCVNTPYSSLVHRAIEKYGKDNFDFKVLGWFEDYNEKEKYYIEYYHSRYPYGYNMLSGGEEPPHWSGEDHPNCKISKEMAEKIKKQLQDWKIPQKTIVHNNKVTTDIVRHIKDGTAWYDENLTYPLRPPEKELDHYRVLYIQWKCCSSKEPLNSLGAKVGWARSSAKMINLGKNHFNKELKYPIRDNSEYNKKYFLNQETCIDYLHFEE